jgi:hypothetical protein
MDLRAPAAVALAAFACFALPACGGTSESVAASESDYTGDPDSGADASPDGGEGGDASADAPASVSVPAYTDADVGTKTLMRWSIDGGAVVEGIEVKEETTTSDDRRFRLTGATPVLGGRPVVYTELGRGPALIEVGTYDCASAQAVVLVIRADGTKVMTAVAGAPSRPCKVIVDEAKEMVVRGSIVPVPAGVRSFRRVTGRIEAEVGPRDDASGPVMTVRAAFATEIMER